MEKLFDAWAIELPYDYPAMAGVLFWGEPPAHARGVRTATFKTRREAREAKAKCPKGSKVIPVSVKIARTYLSYNAEVSGAGTASAGLPGCASNGNYNERTEK